jgi:hypothetical protein
MMIEQINLFGQTSDPAKSQPAKKPKARNVDAEAKQYVAAALIAQWFPELKNVMLMSLIFSMNNATVRRPPRNESKRSTEF